jgi:nucleotide-binding universal stress UspA family protein
MYRRILVPVSGGAASVQGVIEAIRLAGRSNAELRFIHVVDDGRRDDDCAGVAGMLDDVPAPLDCRGCAVVNAARDLAARAGLRGDGFVCNSANGEPCELIAAHARSWQADLIVLGAEPVGAAGLRPGSIGARILQASPVPVMAISARLVAPGRRGEWPSPAAR